ncbi:MAG: hypothetical protein ACOCXA_03995, partial [Planctomycetota bacterium]
LLLCPAAVAEAAVARAVKRWQAEPIPGATEAAEGLRHAAEALQLRHVSADYRRLQHALRGRPVDDHPEAQRLFHESIALQRRLNAQRDSERHGSGTRSS